MSTSVKSEVDIFFNFFLLLLLGEVDLVDIFFSGGRHQVDIFLEQVEKKMEKTRMV